VVRYLPQLLRKMNYGTTNLAVGSMIEGEATYLGLLQLSTSLKLNWAEYARLQHPANFYFISVFILFVK
jgi:hypothetical protein